MNKVVAGIFLILLIIIFVLLLKILIPAFTGYLKNLPKGIFILLLLAVVAAMVYLSIYLVSSVRPGGMQGKPDGETAQTAEQEELAAEGTDCIVLRGDEIWLENEKTDDMEAVERYIDERVDNRVEITIVDDYSFSSLHHRITELCDEKDVKYKCETKE